MEAQYRDPATRPDESRSTWDDSKGVKRYSVPGPQKYAQPQGPSEGGQKVEDDPAELWKRLRLPKRIPSGPRSAISWGGRELSPRGGHEGFYRISGTTRSGKSHLTKLFILDALRDVESNPHAKLIVYEPKREFYKWLASLGLSCPIHYFCPSDARSVALDFVEDFRDEKDARTLAHAFFPERSDRHESPFWGQSLRTIYASIFLAIKAKLGRADLRLVCLVLEDDETTRKVLAHDPYLVQARNLTAKTGEKLDTAVENIHHTVQARIGEMKMIAAHMEHAAKKRPLFSLRRFIKEPRSGVLVVSKDSDYKYVQDPMNAVLFCRFTQLLDKEQQHKARKIYVVVDEFPTLAGDDPCPGAKDMFLRLASRGAIPLVTDQGITSLNPIYQDNTTAILGQCSNVIVLRQGDDVSAEEAARNLGTERGVEKRENLSYGGEYANFSVSDHDYDRTIHHESELRGLPLASETFGIEGFARSAMSPERRPWPFTIKPETVSRIPMTHEAIEEYIELGEDTQRLNPLTADERRKLLS